MCGVATTFGWRVRSCRGVGSSSKTSRPAPAMVPALERREERRLVDDAAAAAVDQQRLLLHAARAGARRSGCCVSFDERRVEGHEVARAAADRRAAAARPRGATPSCGIEERIVGDDLHLEGARARGDALADPARGRRCRGSCPGARRRRSVLRSHSPRFIEASAAGTLRASASSSAKRVLGRRHAGSRSAR